MYSYYPPMQSPLQTAFMPQQPVLAPVQDTQDVQYVNGKAGAESYQMMANRKAILMDANLPRFYLKQTDANGQATVKSYDFKETVEEKPEEYVTKKEFESFKAKLKGDTKHESTNDANRKQQ